MSALLRRRSLWNALWFATPLHGQGHLLAILAAEGVLEAATTLGIDVDQTFAPLDRTVDHPYRRYRWRVGRDGDLPVIHALPPEEEMDWTPWERWTRGPRRTSWVLYPMHPPSQLGVPRWYPLEEAGLMHYVWREHPGAPQRPGQIFGTDWYWYNDETMIPALAKA
jgi:hypothetical protein